MAGLETTGGRRRVGRPVRRSTAARRGTRDLRELDPELLGDDAGVRVPVELLRLSQGPTERLPGSDGRRADGLLVVKGTIACRSQIGGRTAADIFGPGDVISPHLPPPGANGSVDWSRSWTVLQPAEVAVLDVNRVPPDQLDALTRGLLARLAPSADELRLRLAISQSPKLTTRVEAALWRFADRWGRQSVEGVRLAIGLTQGILAECVCAHRTSVVVALGELEDAGRIRREGRGVFLLLGEPPSDLR